MAKEKKVQEVTAADMLEEKKIGEHVVRPWTLGQIIKLTPVFADVVGLCIKAGITLEKAMEIETMPKLLMVILPTIPGIIALTLDITAEEAEGLRGDDATLIITTILTQNLRYLKNLYGPVMELVKSLDLTPLTTED
jgi:hypothetical protein